MSRGMTRFLKIQKYFMMPAAILGLLMIIGSLLFVSKGTFFAHFNTFPASVGGLDIESTYGESHVAGV